MKKGGGDKLSLVATTCKPWNKVLLQEEEENTDWKGDEDSTCWEVGDLHVFHIANEGLETNGNSKVFFLTK